MPGVAQYRPTRAWDPRGQRRGVRQLRRSHTPHAYVLRSGDRPGLEQETWALAHRLPTAAHGHGHRRGNPPGHRPRPGQLYHTALQAAKDQLTSASGVCADQPVDLLGVIGRAVLATLLPARRPRYSARRVKCTTGRYHDRDDARPAIPTTITAIDITMRTPPLDPAPGPARPPQPPTRRQRITAIMNSDPSGAWSGRELAESLQSTSTTSSPSYPNGSAWDSSPAPAPVHTPSPHRRSPGQPHQGANYVALLTRWRKRHP